MTEETQDVSPSSCEKAPRRGLLFLLVLLVLSFLGGASLQYFLPTYMGLWQIPSKWPAKVMELQARIEQIEKKMEDSDRPTETVAQAAPVSSKEDGDYIKLKESVSSVSDRLAALQTQLMQSSESASNADKKAQSGLATVLAFIEMQKSAMEGKSFEKERQVLRNVAGADEALVALLLKLEPIALTGAETAEALRAGWKGLALEAQAAMRKASAQTWQDRIAVALENLVSIRSLKPQAGQALTFAEVDLDLARGDVRAALEKIAAFPSEVQEKLAPWRAKAEARLKLEDDMAALVSFMIARGQKDALEREQPSIAPAAEAKP